MVDPVTVEILRNAFAAVAQEMNATLYRSAFSPIIYEMKDCSVGLFTARAELLGQAPGLPIFLGALDEAVRVVHEHMAPRGVAEGDVYAINDPYLTGSHLNDVTVVSPVFFDGDLVGFTASKAHWLDVGGKDAGVSVDTTEIYQEGLRFGPIRLVHRGEFQLDLLDILTRNSRLPRSLLGDLQAQIAACRTGERRYRGLLRRYGRTTVEAASELIFEQAERADREVIAAIPDGTYTADGYLDGDGVSPDPIYVRVAVTVQGSDLHIDLTGSSPQRPGCTNCGYAQTLSAARLAYKFLINPHQPPTGGHFRALSVTAPPGSIFAAREPAACLYYAPHLGLMIELVLRALSDALPGRVPAGQPSDQMNFMVAGRLPDGQVFITGEASAVGWGALPDDDGVNAVVNYMAGDLKNLPVEVEEAKYPLRVTRRALDPDSGGPGRFRGGLALVKEYLPTAPGCRLVLWLERTVTPAWGAAGGLPGRTARCVIDPGGPRERVLYKANHLPLEPGVVVRCTTAGGGGYGPPWERDAQRVLDDLLDGYISREAAEAVYGVCVRGNEVDEDATRQLRERMRRRAEEDRR
ncbi:MAG: hydantoinase B/oxoprolinase family protein [Armatimonadota bacterium]|nr:hydantoinase B/oxoprolinase family protein [Armatimonadota bacterium]MDR7545298.1 hydantoinase B/oxoprolinase family protein [Armatimonadota bacterium]MDR7612119.1 hydantoinase B/oxoprolinase family protein [Armatimonadota bacterium]